MRIHRIGLVAGVLLAAQLAGTGCILIPKIEKRNVRLVVGRIATVPLNAVGSGATINATATVDLRDSVDLSAALAGAGIDVSRLDSVVIGKVEYRVVSPDLTPTRAITAGNLWVTVAGGAETALIQNFSHSAGAVTPWLRADLTSAGVTQLNQMLNSVLLDLKGGPSSDQRIGYRLSGTAGPSTPPTNFWYQVRLTILVSGRVQTDVLN